MQKKIVLAALATIIATSMLTLGSAEAGMVKVINNSGFVLGVGVTYSDGSKSGPEIINPNSSKPGLGSPVKTVTKIRVVNTTDGTEPGKALLKDYQESSPRLMKDYTVTVTKTGSVEVTEQGVRGGVTLPK
jgi:hypothetical protein